MQLLVGVAAHHGLHEREEVRAGVRLGHAMRDLARRDLQRRVEVDDAVALVVVRVSRRSAGAKRQRQLRALERLDGRLLVDAEHDGVLGRIEIEAHDVLHFLDERRVATDFVRPHQMRFEAVLSQQIGDAAARQAHRLTEQARRPATASRRRRRHGELYDALDKIRRNGVVRPAGLRPLDDAGDTLVAEPRTKLRHVLRRQVEPPGDLATGQPRVAQQEDTRAANEPGRLRRTRDDRIERLALLGGELDPDDLSHGPPNMVPQTLIPHGRRCSRARYA